MAQVSPNKILIADDDRELVREIRSHLEKQGYEVATVEDGFSALRIAQSTPLSLVVLDINFPESKRKGEPAIDGIEVLRRLRESDDVPVLMLSSTSSSSVKVMALKLGADDYLAKPCNIHELSARIEGTGTGFPAFKVGPRRKTCLERRSPYRAYRN